MNAHRARPVSSVEEECEVQIETALRIRPLSKKERDDVIVLEKRTDSESNETEVAILNAPGNGNDRREFHFNHVLPDSTSQDKIYYTLGLPIVTATMNSIKSSSTSRHPKSHLLISMGGENSGKTYTCFGGISIPKRRATQDGLVPRILDSLFSQSSHAGSGSKGFAVEISSMQVTQSNQIHDLLANASTLKNKMFGASPKKKKNLNVRNMAARFERAIPSPIARKAQRTSESGAILDVANLKPTIYKCSNIAEAREALQNSISTSQKLKTGNFYIIMQPIVDGTKIGDKICILDMAGLEKDNKAIIDCLQMLKHNSSSRKAMKPVPFRNHKVTMLLNPLFLHNSFVNITLLLTAYPGYADFQEKAILLNGVETLHTTTYSVSESAHTMHESNHQQIKSKANDCNDRHTSHNDEKHRFTPSEARRDQRQNYHAPKEARDPKVSLKGPPIATRMNKAKSIQHNSRRDYPPTKAIQIPMASASVKKSTTRPTTHKQQDVSSFMYHKSDERKVEPSAPAFDEVHELSVHSKKPKERVVDFPGLESTAPKGDQKDESGMYSVAGNYSVSATGPRRSIRDPREGRDVTQIEEITSTRQQVRKLPDAKRAEAKAPLGRSSLENCDDGSSDKTGRAQQKNRNDKLISRENDRASTSFAADFQNFRNKTESSSHEQMKKLEEQLKKALQEKNAFEKMCSQLENENAELKQLSRVVGRNISRPMTAQKEEEEFQACRKLRLEAQKRIKAPIQEHLDRVNYIYEIKNQWCMTNKKHFSLKLPDHFQRAPDLDVRDREAEHCDDFKTLGRTDTMKSNDTETKNAELRRSVTPTRRMSHQKVTKSPPPTGLSALRRLVGTTLKD